MNASTVTFAVHAIGERVGIEVRGLILSDSDRNCCELTPIDFHPNEGFTVQFCLGWRSVESVFVAGSFSSQLIGGMGECDLEAKQTFRAFVMGATSKKVNVLMRVNGNDVSPTDPSTWPLRWSKLELALKQTPIIVEVENEGQHERLMLDLVVPLFGMVVALIGSEENELPSTGEFEGRAIQSISTRYERKLVNRLACIQMKGTRCEVCGFDFAEVYGSLGIGYIEIHHLTPISTLGPDYFIDVATDLAPLCANCHSMAHRAEPPVPLETLRELVAERRRAQGSGA